MNASSGSTPSQKAKEAAEKAKTWSIVGAVFAVVAAIVLVIIAIVVTMFTFGAAAPAGVAFIIGASLSSAVAVIANLMLVAAQKGHPLAGRFGAAVSVIPRTLQDFTRAARYDAVALDAALRAILQSVTTIEGLGRESEQMSGPCTGDPDAVYQCARQMGPLLSRLAEILQTMQLLSADQTQAAIRTLQNATLVLTRPRVPK